MERGKSCAKAKDITLLHLEVDIDRIAPGISHSLGDRSDLENLAGSLEDGTVHDGIAARFRQ